jgi:hypothetical protein
VEESIEVMLFVWIEGKLPSSMVKILNTQKGNDLYYKFIPFSLISFMNKFIVKWYYQLIND